MKMSVKKAFLYAMVAVALGAVLAGAQSPMPGQAAPSPPAPAHWWQGEKPPWLIGAILGVIIGALGYILGILHGPTLKRWGDQMDLWLQGLGLRFQRKYLKAFPIGHRDIKFVGVRARADAPRPKLDDVYISLQMGSPGSGEEGALAASRELTVGEALQAHKHLVILGEPGAGKSTLLSYLLLQFCGEIQKSRLGLAEKRLPLYVRLKDCVKGEKTICERLAEPPVLPVPKAPPGFFRKHLDRGHCIVLMDGLDEVLDREQKKTVAERVKEMVGDHDSNNRYVITCRTAGWDPNLLPSSFMPLKIRDLNPAQVTRFIHDWYRAVLTARELSTAGARQGEKQEAEERAAAEGKRQADELVDALEKHEGLARLSKTPLILSLIALVHYNRRELPKRRAYVYRDCLDVLLDQWDRDEHQLILRDAPSLNTKIALVQEIAYQLQRRGQDEAEAEELCRLITPILKAADCKVKPKECLKVQIVERSGLLVERAIGRYGFAHRSLQEYLTAKAIVDSPDRGKQLWAHLGEEPWREVTLLYAGMVGKKEASALVKRILGRTDDPSPNLLILAGQCLAEDVLVEEAVKQMCLSRLEAALRSTEDALLFGRIGSVLASIGNEQVVKYFEQLLGEENLRVRVLAAEALGTLGKRIAPSRMAPSLLTALRDDRAIVRQAAANSLVQLGWDSPEVTAALRAAWQEDADPTVRALALSSLVRLGHAGELNLVRIPAGEFLMGSDEAEDEKPPHKVYLDEYYICRYPVSNADFERFVQAGGYSRREWWTKAGWQWKGDRSGPKGHGASNHPVVDVTWHEAMAYAAWLGMRLPAEAEWEKAARGTDERKYPWGNEFDRSKCNTDESGKGTTTPVGAYPEGASPYGILDMAGNVWEWCQSLRRPYPYRPDDGREDVEASGGRVIRGGSWTRVAGDARCAARHGLAPDLFYDNLGFRVVLSPK